jgi:preprotein translocase subunit SecF
MRLFKNAKFPFVEKRYIFFTISAILVLASILGIIFKGINWSTDFTGGVSIIINMQPKDSKVPPLSIDNLRKVINDAGFKEAEIQFIGDSSNATFQIKVGGEDVNKVKEQITEVLTTQLPEYVQGRDMQNDVIRQIDVVGAKAGMEMRNNAIIAVLISMLFMIIYIWIRYEFTFGLMGIVALFHDVIILVGVFAFTQKEFTMTILAALLTLVGYSINDTIVIYDRIREDLKIHRKDSVPIIFNRAINSTLSRTVITGSTTLVTALSLYFFGGPVIHDFALAMSLGIIIGTYSSIFIASNLVLETFGHTRTEKQAIKHLTKKK